MMQNSQTSADQIEMVDVDRPVIDQLAKVKSPTLSAKFGDYRRANAPYISFVEWKELALIRNFEFR
jgi:hypothetical protein